MELVGGPKSREWVDLPQPIINAGELLVPLPERVGLFNPSDNPADHVSFLVGKYRVRSQGEYAGMQLARKNGYFYPPRWDWHPPEEAT